MMWGQAQGICFAEQKKEVVILRTYHVSEGGFGYGGGIERVGRQEEELIFILGAIAPKLSGGDYGNLGAWGSDGMVAGG